MQSFRVRGAVSAWLMLRIAGWAVQCGQREVDGLMGTAPFKFLVDTAQVDTGPFLVILRGTHGVATSAALHRTAITQPF